MQKRNKSHYILAILITIISLLAVQDLSYSAKSVPRTKSPSIQTVASTNTSSAAVSQIHTGKTTTANKNDEPVLRSQGTGGLPGEYHAPVVSQTPSGLQAASLLPASFNLRDQGDLTPVKDQGEQNVCWAFTVATGLESNMLLDGEGSHDFSELHLAYYAYSNTESDPLGLLAGDTLTSTTYKLHVGRAQEATYELADWRGPVEESALPYDQADTYLKSGSPDMAYGNTSAHVQDAYYINLASNPEIVKELLTKLGSASMAYCCDEGAYETSKYYNQNTSSWYHDEAWFRRNNTQGYANTDHVVTLVGWDDEYPASSFGGTNGEGPTPKNNGAWLIRNSWGTEFGDDGYFWLSYEDTSCYDTVTFYNAEAVDNYDKNYQYDGGSMDSTDLEYSSGQAYEASLFTAQDNEEIKAISFYTSEANVSYQVSVYGDVSSSSNPTSGTLLSTQSGSEPYAGYHTIKLSQTAKAGKGSTFSVVVRLKTAKGSLTVLLDDKQGSISLGQEGTFHSATSASKGQSFVSTQGSSWTDTASRYSMNTRVKAFTDTIEEETTTAEPESVEGITTEPESAEPATTEGITENTTQGMTVGTTESTSEKTTEGTTQGASEITTESNIGATSEKTTESTTKITSENTTESTTGDTSEITTENTTGDTSEITTESTIKDTSENTTTVVYVPPTVPQETTSPQSNQRLTYTVTYNANGGTNAPSSQTQYKGRSLILSNATPTRDGCTFKGWTLNANSSKAQYLAGSRFQSNQDVTLYALWTKNSSSQQSYPIYRPGWNPYLNWYFYGSWMPMGWGTPMMGGYYW